MCVFLKIFIFYFYYFLIQLKKLKFTSDRELELRASAEEYVVFKEYHKSAYYFPLI